MNRAVLGIGGNIGNREDYLVRAAGARGAARHPDNRGVLAV